MNPVIVGACALLAYAVAALGFARSRRDLGLAAGGLALLGHAAVLWPLLTTARGVHFGLFDAASTVGVCIAGLVLALNLQRPLQSLAAVVLPFTAGAMLLDIAFPAPPPPITQAVPFGLYLHIALALVAYSLFAIAAMQALLLLFATRQLRQHHPVLHFMPPLPTMEAVMFRLTAFAFGLLTPSLLLGVAFVQDVRTQHLSHKIVFSLLAWAVFVVLLIGRWCWEWRGRRATRYVLSGFALLALSFFGTKFVLELVLHRN
jgi:ABC-type uncharacterized transport system permease subunit